MSTILDEGTQIVIQQGNSARVTVPKKWLNELNLTPGEEIIVAKIHGKHGLFLGVWNKNNQPTLELERNDL